MSRIQSLRLVQSLMQELERKPSKTTTDETELAKLLLKQQQILSTGRPIENIPSTLNLPKVPPWQPVIWPALSAYLLLCSAFYLIYFLLFAVIGHFLVFILLGFPLFGSCFTFSFFGMSMFYLLCFTFVSASFFVNCNKHCFYICSKLTSSFQFDNSEYIYFYLYFFMCYF